MVLGRTVGKVFVGGEGQGAVALAAIGHLLDSI